MSDSSGDEQFSTPKDDVALPKRKRPFLKKAAHALTKKIDSVIDDIDDGMQIAAAESAAKTVAKMRQKQLEDEKWKQLEKETGLQRPSVAGFFSYLWNGGDPEPGKGGPNGPLPKPK